MSATISKKKQKALAFRAKQKGKGKGVEEPEAVPEADLDEGDGEEAEATIAVSTKTTAAKKRKRADDDEDGEGEESSEAKAEGKTKGKGKETEGDDGDAKKKTKKDIKQRFILFIGNLGFRTTREQVQNHFKPAIERMPSVRLLTERATTPGQAPKSRGIAFLELSTSAEMQACLKLHGSKLNGRIVNVELTAGGGGKSDARRSKIRERNTRVGGQRERRAEKEREEADKEAEKEQEEKRGRVGEGNGQGWGEDQGGNGRAEEDGSGIKTRGGRRVKAKTSSDHPAKRPRTDGQLAGWANRAGSGAGAPPSRGGRRPKWEPTGANAVFVPK